MNISYRANNTAFIDLGYDNYGHPDLYVTRAMLAMLYIVVVLIVVSYILLKIRVRKL